MAEYTQAGRPLRVETDAGPDKVLLHGFAGREGISTPFEYELELYSVDSALDVEALLRTNVTVSVTRPDGDVRHIHGRVRRMVQLQKRGDLTHYRAEIVPWFWFTKLRRDARIFHEVDARKIIETLFDEMDYGPYVFRLADDPPVRTYCVQYRESTFDFISRLLEEEGIYYYFEHSDTAHTMVLADMNTEFKECPGQASARLMQEAAVGEDAVTSFESEHAVQTSKVTLWDYDPIKLSPALQRSVEGDEALDEAYDYPGRFDDVERGRTLATVRLEALERERNVLRGSSTCRSFQSGYKFDLRDHYRADANTSYVLTGIEHRCFGQDYMAWGDSTLEYENTFTAIPATVRYRPSQRTSKPVVRGSQTALVVGPSGEEVHTDKYGRVKVQFYWDREGKMDGSASCWVRVAAASAGKGWGQVQIPRIGQEVIVDFLEGDPDRPLITGRVYNARMVQPYSLPADQLVSGMKSRSSPGGGGYNEIAMDDAKDEELIRVHAQKDMDTAVENDEARWVGNDRSTKVENDETLVVGHDRLSKIENDETLWVVNNRTSTVDVDDTESVGGNQTVDVGKDMDVTVGGGRTVTITADDTLTVKGDQAVEVSGDYALDASEVKIKTAGNLTISTSGTITLTAGTIKLNA